VIDNKLRLNANYFHYDYSGLQLSQLTTLCFGPCQVTTNAATAKVDGVELEGSLAVDDRNRIDFAATWLDARFSNYQVVPGVNFAGRKLDRSPEWTFNIGYTHTIPLADGGSLSGTVRTRSSDAYFLLSSVLRTRSGRQQSDLHYMPYGA
jgi:iron complex outermembrane receptor protein